LRARPARRASRRPATAHRSARTRDGIAIAYTLWRRPSRELVLVAPGFWRERHDRENLFLAEHLFRLGYDVAALDFRGHGESEGAYAFGLTEGRDIRAVVGELVGEGRFYERFAAVGLSMGGSILAEELAQEPSLPCRALAMISSPADVLALRPKPWKPDATRQLHWKRALRVPRIATRDLFAPKPRAVEAIARITAPKLIVTAEDDWLVDPSHGRLLAEAAAPPVEHVHLELPGSLHADALVRLVPRQILRVLDRWLRRHAPP
jgi:pimeloyl-ACP methyl ester carboxylesterase